MRKKELLQLLPHQLAFDKEVKWPRRLCIIRRDVSMSQDEGKEALQRRTTAQKCCWENLLDVPRARR